MCAGLDSSAHRPPPSVDLPPTPPGGSPHGFSGDPSCPQSAKLKLAPSPPLAYRAPSATNDGPDGVAGILLAPVLDQDLL